VDGLWATKSEDVGLTFRAFSFQVFQHIIGLCGHDPPTSQTDLQTPCNRDTALWTIVHHAVKTNQKGVNDNEQLKIYS